MMRYLDQYMLDEPIRILHVISGDLWAGAEVQVYNTLRTLNKRGYFLLACVVFNDGILKVKLENERIATFLIDENKLYSIEMLWEFKRVINKHKPHIIHVHAVKEHFIAWMSSLLFFRSIPIIRTVHGENSVPDGIPFMKKIRAEVIVFLDKLMKKYMSNAVIAVTKDLEQRFIKNKYKGKIFRIYNAVENSNQLQQDNIKTVRDAFEVNKKFWIGTAARLEEIKNIQMLIHAGSHLKEKGIPFKISIFGDGSLKHVLQDLINEKDLNENIFLHGFQSNVIPIVQALDVFVLCSFHEGLPMSLLEAMSCGTPAICSAVGGMKEIIEHGYNGLLVESNDSKALAEACLILYMNKVKSDQLAENAKITVNNNFSLETAVNQLRDIYYDFVFGNKSLTE
jgi:L-malate glycosyltransferase